MILASGARGREFDSRNNLNRCMTRGKGNEMAIQAGPDLVH